MVWIDVPDNSVITEPNKARRTMVWPVYLRRALSTHMDHPMRAMICINGISLCVTLSDFQARMAPLAIEIVLVSFQSNV